MQSQPILDVPITGEPIRLGQFLKLAGLADNGSTAKELLEGDEVTVNGEPEFRRGRQLTNGDLVAVRSERRRVTLEVPTQSSIQPSIAASTATAMVARSLSSGRSTRSGAPSSTLR
jgi:ribosome-associated protein